MGKTRPRTPSTQTISYKDDPSLHSPEARATFEALRAEIMSMPEWLDHPGLDDDFLWRQTVGADFKLEKALESSLRGLRLSRQWSNHSIAYSDVKRMVDKGILWCHNKDKLGRPTLIVRLSLFRPTKANCTESLKGLFFMLEECLRHMNGPVQKYVVVIDAKGFGWSCKCPRFHFI